MNLYELFNQFWYENEYSAFSLSETALYSYLLNKANRRKWQMPIRCPTNEICLRLKTTKQNIVKARLSLKQRGLIDFIAGKDNDTPAIYTIIDVKSQLPPQLSSELSHQLSSEMSHQLSPLYNNKDKYYSKEKIEKSTAKNVSEKYLSLPELLEQFLLDTNWQENVAELLLRKVGNKISIDNVREYIKEFILYLKTGDKDKLTIGEAKKYFVNWITKILINKKTKKYERSNDDLRRTSEGNDNEASAYYESF